MQLVTQSVLNTLMCAVADCTAYGKGRRRRELQAAFDIACSQIVSTLLGFQSANRYELRLKLNSIALDDVAANRKPLISAMRAALKHCEPLFSRDYSDHEEECSGFL